MFKLTIEDDEGKTTVVPLARDEMTIGRLEGNTIRLTERNVSRRHARLVRQNGALYIEDLASFTGVRVNGAKIATPTPLREGDEVQIGDYRLALRGERTTAALSDRPARSATGRRCRAFRPSTRRWGRSADRSRFRRAHRSPRWRRSRPPSPRRCPAASRPSPRRSRRWTRRRWSADGRPRRPRVDARRRCRC